jgi:hypothetical protein
MLQGKLPNMHIFDRELYCSSHDITDELGKAVTDKNYDVVKKILSNNTNADPNLEINFLGGVYMTALEFSVYNGDWKMTLLLFMNGADPSYNCFDGTIQSNGFQTKDLHHAFKNRTSIPGFQGLRALIGKSAHSNVMHACLWLMEYADGGGNVDSSIDAVKILSNISTLFQNLEQVNGSKKELIMKGAEYINNCYQSFMSRIHDQSNNTAVMNNELFEIVLFSLRLIVLNFIDLQ